MPFMGDEHQELLWERTKKTAILLDGGELETKYVYEKERIFEHEARGGAEAHFNYVFIIRE